MSPTAQGEKDMSLFGIPLAMRLLLNYFTIITTLDRFLQLLASGTCHALHRFAIFEDVETRHLVHAQLMGYVLSFFGIVLIEPVIISHMS